MVPTGTSQHSRGPEQGDSGEQQAPRISSKTGARGKTREACTREVLGT